MASDPPILPREQLSPDQQPEPDWKVYESAIARLEESYKNCTVIRNHKLNGKSGVERQVDVWLSTEIGHNHVVTVAIECRRYSDRPVSIKDIDAFYGFLEDVGADKGVMISNTRFTDGARKRADNADIELTTLTLAEATEFDWQKFARRRKRRRHHRRRRKRKGQSK
jgi:predicted helicase